YPGPYDHDGAETAAYENACRCTLIAVGGSLPPICTSGLYMTINGPRTVDQMRSELRVAGYPNWQWASDAEIVSVYGRTSGAPINGCASSQPPPSLTLPAPSSLPDPVSLALVAGATNGCLNDGCLVMGACQPAEGV